MNPYGKSERQGDSSALRNSKANPRSLRPMLHCWFCGGRVVLLKTHAYRCEAEGVRWDGQENLVLYERPPGPFRLRDTDTGRYLSPVEARA